MATYCVIQLQQEFGSHVTAVCAGALCPAEHKHDDEGRLVASLVAQIGTRVSQQIVPSDTIRVKALGLLAYCRDKPLHKPLRVYK